MAYNKIKESVHTKKDENMVYKRRKGKKHGIQQDKRRIWCTKREVSTWGTTLPNI